MTKVTYLPAKTETVVVEPEKVVLELTVQQAKVLKLILGRTIGSQFEIYDVYKHMDNLRALDCSFSADKNIPSIDLSKINL